MDQLYQTKKLAASPTVATPAPSPDGAKTVTRVELLDAVYNACPTLSRAQARQIFEMTLDEIVGALVQNDSVKLRSFGAFTVRSKRERVGRNPRTGVEAKITARRVLTFKASPTLIARINGDAPVEE
jgi:integration host factor subunit alpha